MHQKGALSDDPSLPRGRKREGWNQLVDVGVKAQIPRPGLQHAQHPNLPAEEAWVLRELLQSRGGGTKEQRVDRACVLARHRPQTRGEREGDQKVRYWEQQVLLPRQPGLGSLVLAPRTMAVPTGVVAIAGRHTRRTGIDMAAKRLGSARFNRPHGLVLLN